MRLARFSPTASSYWEADVVGNDAAHQNQLEFGSLDHGMLLCLYSKKL